MDAFDHNYQYDFLKKKVSCTCEWSERVEDAKAAYANFSAHLVAEKAKVPA